MENNKNNLLIADAINCSIQKDFTQVPNNFLRNPNISMKAKIILCILLGNKQGWHSYIKGIKNMLKEGLSTIQTVVKELEENHYLLRIKFREKHSKIWRGSFWAYTDIQNTFNIQKTIEYLDSKNLECLINKQVYPYIKNPCVDKPYKVNPNVDNQLLIILNTNNTKEKKTNSKTSVEVDTIKSTNFDTFWKLYPKKTDKGKALTSWNKLCNKKKKDKPTLRQIRKAIHFQKITPRWQDKQFIPNPTTWLNQSRWLDDPNEMKNYLYNKETVNNKSGSMQYEDSEKMPNYDNVGTVHYYGDPNDEED